MPTPTDPILYEDDQPDLRQIRIWQAMTPADRIELAFEAFQIALDAARADERRQHPELDEEELALRVARRISGDAMLGRDERGKHPR